MEAMQSLNVQGHSDKFILVESIIQTCDIVNDILLKEEILAIDCEGIILSKEGRLTLIQIGLADERVFMFDILKGGTLMFLGLSDDRPGLKAVLENKKIVKVLHDCRNDWDSLLYQYSVRLFGFIDTQEAYYVYSLFYHQEINLPISLFNFIKIFCNEQLEKKQQMKHQMKEDPTIWSKRPIDTELMIYAAEDVLYLIKAWNTIRFKLNDYLIEIIKVLSIFKVVDSDMFNQFSEYLTKLFFDNFQLVLRDQMSFDVLVAMDYVYGFFEMKNDEENISSLIVKSGYDYKKKQRVSCLQEIMNQYKQSRKQISNSKNNDPNARLSNSFKKKKNTKNDPHGTDIDHSKEEKNENLLQINHEKNKNSYRKKNKKKVYQKKKYTNKTNQNPLANSLPTDYHKPTSKDDSNIHQLYPMKDSSSLTSNNQFTYIPSNMIQRSNSTGIKDVSNKL